MKNWEWIKKGVPLRIEIGPRDLARRAQWRFRAGDKGVKEKQFLPGWRRSSAQAGWDTCMRSSRRNLDRALRWRTGKRRRRTSIRQPEFYAFFTPKLMRRSRKFTEDLRGATGVEKPPAKRRSRTI